jgi:hypothetical protein
MTDLISNVLYYGDNLDILCRYVPDAQLPGFDGIWPRGQRDG